MKLLLLILFSFTLHSKPSVEEEPRQPFRLTIPNYAWGMSIINAHDIEVMGVDRRSNKVDILATQWELDMLRAYATTSYNKKAPLDTDSAVTVSNIPDEIATAYPEEYQDYYHSFYAQFPDDEYRNYEEVREALYDYQDRFPKIAKVEVIGHSIEGREILAMKISDNVDRRELKEPTILFNSMHHAREVMTPEVTIDIIETLLNGYWKNLKITRWVKSNEIWVVPMVNPDGNNRVWTEDKYWRKNVRDEHGVDLNRNYPYDWGQCNGSSGYIKSGTYRGEYPASEPETQAIMALVENIRPVFDISYHSYSELVIYPYGCAEKKAHQIVAGIGEELGRQLDYEAGTAWELLYSVAGCDIDWMYAEYQVLPYVIEVSSMYEGFQPMYSTWRDVTVEKNRAGWRYLLDRLQGPGVRGIVRDSKKNPVSKFLVRVESEGELVQEYRGNPDGTYHIVLESGEYELTFMSEAHKSVTKKIHLTKRRVKRNIKLISI